MNMGRGAGGQEQMAGEREAQHPTFRDAEAARDMTAPLVPPPLRTWRAGAGRSCVWG